LWCLCYIKGYHLFKKINKSFIFKIQQKYYLIISVSLQSFIN
jgi:hypothetical protein